MTIEAMNQALEALENVTKDYVERRQYKHNKAIDALRAAIAEAEKQEPVAWFGLEPSDMPDGDNTMYDHDFFLKGMAWADAILRKKNTTPPAAPVQVSPADFINMVRDKEDVIGKPIYWAEWPNKENNT